MGLVMGAVELYTSVSVFMLKIPIAVSGIRGMGFLMKYHMEEGGNLPPKLSNLFIKVRLFMLPCIVFLGS